MKTYRLGIVGLGRMGSTIDAEVEDYPAITLPYSIAAAARAVPRLELAAGCDIVEEKNRAFRDKWGVTSTYTDYDKMLAAEKLDMVAICTPGSLHAHMTLAAARAGVPMIYCEKAMACSMQEADEVKKALESRHTVYNTGVLRRFDPRYHQARELIQHGRLGAPAPWSITPRPVCCTATFIPSIPCSFCSATSGSSRSGANCGRATSR